MRHFGFLRSQRVRPGGGFAGRETRSVRVMAGDTILPRDRAGLPPPIAGGASVRSGLPITIGWTVTTATQGCALDQFQLPPVAGLKLFEIIFVMAIETQIVSVMAPMSHDDVGVFFRHYQDVIGVEPQWRRFVSLVTCVAIEIR